MTPSNLKLLNDLPVNVSVRNTNGVELYTSKTGKQTLIYTFSSKLEINICDLENEYPM